MTITKNITLALSLSLLLAGFAFTMQNYAYAASMSETKDVCAELDTVESKDSADDNNDAEDQCEKAEAIKLAKDVKITAAEASKTATTNNPGKGSVTEILLARDEDDAGVSRLVYEIELTSISGLKVDIKVDALTGKYLGIDTEDDEDREASDDGAVVMTPETQSLQAQLISLLQQLLTLLKS